MRWSGRRSPADATCLCPREWNPSSPTSGRSRGLWPIMTSLGDKVKPETSVLQAASSHYPPPGAAANDGDSSAQAIPSAVRSEVIAHLGMPLSARLLRDWAARPIRNELEIAELHFHAAIDF